MRLYQDAHWLYCRYWEKGCTLQEMAGEAKCSITTVYDWMDRAGIERRPRGVRPQLLEDRFWSKVDIRGDDECWKWVAAKARGYGRFSAEGQLVYAHRVAWELAFGPIPKGMFVCHHCDNSACCNPGHLFLGTNADNLADMARKGRAARGTRNSNAKLTRADILGIRQLWAETNLPQREIGKMFGVGQQAVSKIVHRRNWGWL